MQRRTMRLPIPVWPALTLLVFALGCTHPSRVAFSRDFSCPVSDVRTQPLYMGAYQVTGCGKSAGYHCPSVPPGAGCRRDEAVVQRRHQKDRDTLLRRRFEADTGCAARHARVARSASGSFIVTGCGREQSYVCVDEGCEPTANE